MKGCICFFTTCCLAIASCSATAFADESLESILYNKNVEFAQKYDADEEMIDKVIAMYPDRDYISGIEKREDGTEYELPAFYFDSDALKLDSYSLTKQSVNIKIAGEYYDKSNECIIYNGVTFVPEDAIAKAGAQIEIDSSLLTVTYTKDDTVIEVQPYSTMIRKNRENGYWIPLAAGSTARIESQKIYIPLRAVAQELGIAVGWDDATKTVTLD